VVFFSWKTRSPPFSIEKIFELHCQCTYQGEFNLSLAEMITTLISLVVYIEFGIGTSQAFRVALRTI
jgi:hypothetical protein